MLRTLTVCLCAAVAACALAQSAKTIKLTFPSEGNREVWLQSKSESATVPETKSVNGKAVELKTTAADDKELAVFVHDKATGMVATHLVSDLKDGGWTVGPDEYKLVRGARVTVSTDKGPVASAQVDLTLGDVKRTALLSPSDKGVVSFNLLPPGDGVFTVKYKVGGADKSLDPQTFTIKPTTGGWVDVKLTVPDGADIVPTEPVAKPGEGAAKPSDAGDKPKDQEKTSGPGSVIGLLVNMLVGLGLVGGLGYAAWWYVKHNRDKVTEIMDKAGVPLNQDPADPTGAAPVVPQAPKPIVKIVLDGTDPSPAPAVSTVGTPVRNPRLVASDGTVVALAVGTVIVGREAGLDISLPDEGSVSRRHASIQRDGGTVTLSDDGSTNGTYVNGSKLSAPAVLHPGDTVQFGAVAYRYEE
ncbi:MAG: FHA domain-containing protein [Fimbriimonadaceae bacterium]|nr:FHA domain-containing protein [Fimbriimonadaceae bacterium]